MKVLHTSDWHIGKTLYGSSRYAEFAAFLDWLTQLVQQEEIDVLLVSGDIFDTATPGNNAQYLYYNFLSRLARTTCRHAVITGGNHDSAAFLNAPAALLRPFNIHVVGSAKEDAADEALLLKDAEGKPELIVCAVPYLRERDLRLAESGESLADKDTKLLHGIQTHYARCVDAARVLQAQAPEAPLIIMGHLFAAGSSTSSDDGMRELYVGSLAQVPASVFPSGADYIALGHIHSAQQVAGNSFIRYSGSPLQLGFGDAEVRKSMCIVDFSAGKKPDIELINVPVFQPLKRISGNWSEISSRLGEFALSGKKIWLELEYTGDEILPDLADKVADLTEGTELKVLRIRNCNALSATGIQQSGESLDELTVEDVFTRCLDSSNVPDEQRSDLLEMFAQVVTTVYERENS